AGPLRDAEHHLGVDAVLRAAEADEVDGGAGAHRARAPGAAATPSASNTARPSRGVFLLLERRREASIVQRRSGSTRQISARAPSRIDGASRPTMREG